MNDYITQIQEISHPNKYTTWYCSIIQQALTRNQPVTGQAHHIIPRSFGLGGITDPQNIVMLTFREHYIAHLLLPKMVKNKQYKIKMVNAIVAMCVGLTRNSGAPSNLYASRRFSQVRTMLITSGVFATGKDTLWVNNGTKSKRITEPDITQYVNNGWELGRHTFTRVSTIDINKDGITKRIDPAHRSQYHLDGWVLGRAPTTKVCVTNGIKNIHVDPNNIPDGYTIGSHQKTQAGRVWVTNGMTDVYLAAGQDIPVGWVKGRSNKSLTVNKSRNTGKIKINDGTIQKYHPETDSIPEGWVKGGLSPKKKWTWSKNQELSNLVAQSPS